MTPLAMRLAARYWRHLGGDLEGSYDGSRYVDIRVKGTDDPVVFASPEVFHEALGLFPRQGAYGCPSCGFSSTPDGSAIYDAGFPCPGCGQGGVVSSNPHHGSTLDSLLEETGELAEVSTMAQRLAAKYKGKKKTDKGNTVYMYSEKQIEHRNREKAKRIEKLRGKIGDVRAKVKKDLKSDDPEVKLTALAVALMDHTYERVGNEESADDGHFGVTGWQKGHVSFGKGKARLKYVGKSGVKHDKDVTDKAVLSALRDAYEAVEGEEASLFEYEGGKVTAEKVNAYLKDFDITAKDIRGFHANQEMKDRLKEERKKGGALPEDKKKREKQLKEEFKAALEATAEAVGHEPSTLRSQYLVPGLEDDYMDNGKIDSSFTKGAATTWVYEDGPDAYCNPETGECQPNGPADKGPSYVEAGYERS